MRPFSVFLTQDAENDLKEIKNYIASNISSKTALRIICLIKSNIEKLSFLPEFAVVVKYEPWNSLGIRRIAVGNFFVYYRVDLEERVVYILKVTYSRRNQKSVLSQIDF